MNPGDEKVIDLRKSFLGPVDSVSEVWFDSELVYRREPPFIKPGYMVFMPTVPNEPPPSPVRIDVIDTIHDHV